VIVFIKIYWKEAYSSKHETNFFIDTQFNTY